MYNTQTLSFKEIIYKFADNWQQPFKVLTAGVPYGSPGIIILTVICLIMAVSVWKKRKILGTCSLLALLYVIFALAYVSPYDVFFMFRIHSYSVPYFYAILWACVWVGGTKLHHNLLLLFMLGLVCLFIRADFVVQKVWYLGNKQDAAAVERIKEELLPELISQKAYRLSTIGNLYGRQKFAKINFASEYKKDVYREYWGAPYFLSILFSSGFWGYEEKNPIWGDAIYLGDNIVYGTNNENLSREEELKAKIFAMDFGTDKDKMIPAIKQLQVFPKKPYFFVGEKDIFLMLSNDARVKNVLISNMLGSK